MKVMNISAHKNIKITSIVVLLANLFMLIINIASQLFFTDEKMVLMVLFKQFLKSMNTIESNDKSFQQSFDHDWRWRRKFSIK